MDWLAFFESLIWPRPDGSLSPWEWLVVVIGIGLVVWDAYRSSR